MNANELADRIVKTANVNSEWCLGLDLPVGGIWEGCESKEHAEACAARIRPALAQAVDQVVSWRVREILRGPRIIYLASPYSHPLPEVREARFRTVCRVAARLMSEGAIVFSPIAHSHPIAMAGQLPTDWTFWDRYDRAMLEASAELWVLRLDGWKDSTGVVAEIDIATHLGKPIWYIDALPEEMEEAKTVGDEATAAIEAARQREVEEREAAIDAAVRTGYANWWCEPAGRTLPDVMVEAVRPLLAATTTTPPIISAYQSPDDEAAEADRKLPDRFDVL